MITWRWEGSGKIRIGISGNGNHKFKVEQESRGTFRLTDNGNLIGTFAGIEGACRAAHELVKALSRAHSQPHSFGRNPSRFGDSFATPARLLRRR
jgi:hypothetical protein